MKKLLSLPPNLVGTFHSLDPRFDNSDWFCTCDPADSKLGSGAGTAWLLDQWEKSDTYSNRENQKKIIIHAGGHSRRLPAYASVGKLLAPIPVLRWALGQRIDQTLLSLQLPLYESILSTAKSPLNTLIASGDVCITTDIPVRSVPDADVVCYGLWAEPTLASHHGVFLSRRESPDRLDFMLQKPSVEELARLGQSHYYLMDIGLWLLSDKALNLLRRKSKDPDGNFRFYDLYSQFGRALGSNPSLPDPELSSLTIAIVPLQGGEFYHFGTTRELLSSTLALQNKVADQRLIMHRDTKPNPALFVQNCIMDHRLTSRNNNVWIENSHIAEGWQLTSENVVTGVPANDWTLTLPPGICLDITPLGTSRYVVRPYGYDDTMRGDTAAHDTTFMGQPLSQWLNLRAVELGEPHTDIQSAHLFPIVDNIKDMDIIARWMTSEPSLEEGRRLWLNAERLSADDICSQASLPRLYAQRREFLKLDIPLLADNYRHSIFYQLDLSDLADKMYRLGIPAPDTLPADDSLKNRIRNHMLRARLATLYGDTAHAETDESEAFSAMRQGILSSIESSKCSPIISVLPDQIVWGRSPVRIDLAGGWTDTPPYSIFNGGSVINMAVEPNGQPPLQVFIKPSAKPHIILRSIDLGASETIESYSQLLDFSRVGSPFSIPKAALALAGFAPQFCAHPFSSLSEQLSAIGSGIEITLLSAVPAGSGLGTSSILAATVLGALSDFCGLAWDTDGISSRALALEQMLTTGGGWQDQYGGLLQGVKLLQSGAGLIQRPNVNWLPEGLFTDPTYAPCHLLYYTGITRTAKNILSEIVKRMFLNSSETLDILDSMKHHTREMATAIQRRDFTRFGELTDISWGLNKRLDPGTNPPAVQSIISSVAQYLAGCKLTGAGGGGFLYMVAKDPEAAVRIRGILSQNPTGSGARFVDMAISGRGLQISRS